MHIAATTTMPRRLYHFILIRASWLSVVNRVLWITESCQGRGRSPGTRFVGRGAGEEAEPRARYSRSRLSPLREGQTQPVLRTQMGEGLGERPFTLCGT